MRVGSLGLSQLVLFSCVGHVRKNGSSFSSADMGNAVTLIPTPSASEKERERKKEEELKKRRPARKTNGLPLLLLLPSSLNLPTTPLIHLPFYAQTLSPSAPSLSHTSVARCYYQATILTQSTPTRRQQQCGTCAIPAGFLSLPFLFASAHLCSGPSSAAAPTAWLTWGATKRCWRLPRALTLALLSAWAEMPA